MEANINDKGCLVPEHTNKLIALICIDKKCQEKSRLLCQDCIMERKKIHKNCDTYLSFDDFKSNQIALKYTEDSQIKKLFDWAYKPEEELYEQINQKYQEIYIEIGKKIEELKKETKIKILEKQKNLKEELKEYIEKQKNLSDLTVLQEEIAKFNEKQISLDKLNELLIEKQQQHFSQEEEQLYLNQYKESINKNRIKEIDPKMFEKLSNSMTESLEKYQFYPKYKNIIIKELKLINGCDGTFTRNNNQYIKSSKQNTYLNFQSQAFQKNENVQFKFRLRNYTSSKNVQIGITTFREIQNGRYYFNFNEGNDIYFGNQNNFYKGGQKLGQKWLSEVCSEGQEFVLDVCVQENLVVLKDVQEQCIIESTYDFNSNSQEQEWVIVIGDNSGQPQNFTIEVL